MLDDGITSAGQSLDGRAPESWLEICRVDWPKT
jgi:hypothetical protein